MHLQYLTIIERGRVYYEELNRTRKVLLLRKMTIELCEIRTQWNHDVRTLHCTCI